MHASSVNAARARNAHQTVDLDDRVGGQNHVRGGAAPGGGRVGRQVPAHGQALGGWWGGEEG